MRSKQFLNNVQQVLAKAGCFKWPTERQGTAKPCSHIYREWSCLASGRSCSKTPCFVLGW